jgi:hypothetical protein
MAAVSGVPADVVAQSDPTILFAVVTKVPRDHATITVQAATASGTAFETVLVPSEPIRDNLIWRKVEVCHSLRVEAWKNQETYRVVGIRALDAGMLPMSLQSLAGDCLIKKALEFPLQGD